VIVHTVAPGDTLQTIAARYGVTFQAVAAANGLSLDTVLQIDQKLVIPQG
jgi:LysM repeat protein